MSNHLGKTSLRVEVLGVLLHVLGEAVDSIGKDSNLNLGRTGILLIDLVLSDDGGLGFLSNHFFFTFLIFYPYAACGAGEKHKPRKGISQTERGHTQHKAIGQHGNYSTQSAKSKEFLQKIFYFSSFCNFIKEIKSVLM